MTVTDNSKSKVVRHEFLVALGVRLVQLDLIFGLRRRVVATVEKIEAGGEPGEWMTVLSGPIAVAARLRG